MALELKGSRADPRAFSEQLAATLDAILDDAIEHAAAFRPGLAFCHRCEGAACEHAVPPSSRHVFIGYAPTGMPRWDDFAQICLDRRHPSVDQLYEESPAFLTLIEGARPLTASLVDAFHAQHRYHLLGQVTAGFYAIRPRAGEGREVLAVTFQVAASRSRDGKVRLGLNILGRTPSGEPLGLLWERQDEIPWLLQNWES